MRLRSFGRRVLSWSGPVVLVLFALWKIADWGCERWWFQSAGYASQWNLLMEWRAVCFICGALLMALWLGFHAQLAWRNTAHSLVPLTFFETPTPLPFIPHDDKLRLDCYRRRATLWTVGLLAWLAGIGCASRYMLFLRAYIGEPTAEKDAASSLNLGFFLFHLPLLELMSYFALAAIILALLLVSAIYFYESALMIGDIGRKKRQQAPLRHIAALWALLLLWKGADCLLGVVTGFVSAGNVAMRVFDPVDTYFGWVPAAIFALATPLVSLLSAIALVNRPRYHLFLLGVGWMLCSSIVPRLLPLVVGHAPRDGAWLGAITRHIHSTRRAWGLDDIQQRTLSHVPLRSLKDWHDSEDSSFSSAPLPLWPAVSAREAMNARLDAQESGLYVSQVHLERRTGGLAYVGVALPVASELQTAVSRPAAWWEMDACRTTAAGTPLFAPAVPVRATFGSPEEQVGEAAQTDTRLVVQDTSSSAAVQGVGLQNWAVRATLALRFFEPRLLRTPASDERLIWHRGAAERCRQIAPFLSWPVEEARPVLIPNHKGQRLFWILSGLVWTNDYPDSASPPPGTGPEGANYGRQVAVGVVDATSGAVQLFTLDDSEPFTALYRRAFPRLFLPLAALDSRLRAQVRPSPSLWRAQSLLWARYHEDNAASWEGKQTDWRPLISPTWEDEAVERTMLSQPSGEWRVVAYADAIGQAGASNATSPLVAMLGNDERRFALDGGQLRIVNWQAVSPLPLPDTLAEPSLRIMDNRTYPPLPTCLGLAPQFDGHGAVNGLIATRGEVEKDPKDSTALSFFLKARVTTVDNRPHRNVAPQLTTLRQAWQQLLSARRVGDWKGVAHAETQLDRLLGVP